MKKYEVRQTNIEVNRFDIKRYGNALGKFYNSTNQEMQVLASFDTEEEARDFFDNATVWTVPSMGSGVKYDLYDYMTITEVELDEDGDFVSEEDIDSQISDAPEDESEDADEEDE